MLIVDAGAIYVRKIPGNTSVTCMVQTDAAFIRSSTVMADEISRERLTAHDDETAEKKHEANAAR